MTDTKSPMPAPVDTTAPPSQTVCAWCGTTLAVHNNPSGPKSHGICAACAAEQLAGFFDNMADKIRRKQ